MQQLQYHDHTYVHCVCSYPIRLSNRLRGYNMIGYGGHPVNVISTTVFRTLEEKSGWVLLLLTHWRLLSSWILLFSFHHLPFAGISLSYFPCSWSSQICTCAVAKEAAPPFALPISGLTLQLQVTIEVWKRGFLISPKQFQLQYPSLHVLLGGVPSSCEPRPLQQEDVDITPSGNMQVTQNGNYSDYCSIFAHIHLSMSYPY